MVSEFVDEIDDFSVEIIIMFSNSNWCISLSDINNVLRIIFMVVSNLSFWRG